MSFLKNRFEEILSDLNKSIDKISSSKEEVAAGTINLINLSAESEISIAEKIKEYREAIRNLIYEYRNIPAESANAKNQWASARLMLNSLMVACAGSVVADSASKSIFKSREEAVKTATDIAEIYDEVLKFEEKRIALNIFVETGESFSAMQEVVSGCIQYIIENSFALPTRKQIILGEDRQVIELVYSLYGSLARLDEFIVDNKLNYNEIEIVPMGREVTYYV